MKKEVLKQILKDLKKDKECVYPYLKLSTDDIELLEKNGIRASLINVTMSHFLIDGTYERKCVKLSKLD